MNSQQNSRFRMFRTVQGALDENISTWNTVPVITKVKNNFDELILRVEAKQPATAEQSTPVTQTKNNLRKALAQKAAVVSGIMQSYAAINDNEELQMKTKMNESDMFKLKENELESVVLPLLTLTREHLEDLGDYGLTEEMLNEVETTLDDFNALIGQPRTIRNKTFAAIDEIEGLIKAGLDLLNNQLDKLMLRFKNTNAEFYNSYLRARQIVDL